MTESDDVGVVWERGDVVLGMVLTGPEGGPDDGTALPQPHLADGPQRSCLRSWRERRGAARGGFGPVPECTITFRLLDAPGYFAMTSSPWDFAALISHVRAELASEGRRSKVWRLRLVGEERTTRGGQVVTYRRPEVLVNAK
ncbi:hypothetical protein GCM10010121_075290 [Streptomyces brasiliensis]|uniref:Uncharacterized protein n=1 Tax=Streptomyces brasiliensis TaxID=1954 RepID=A0A917P1S1_9ACTN|nr:hypothetical protein GCM10010121_075290 [Streptomyces brasiliensis]